MNKLLYHLLFVPVTKLPIWWMYRISDLLYWVLYRGLGYRQKVVLGNMRSIFPEKSAAEIRRLADAFYSHFFDLIVETLRVFSMPAEEVKQRCTLTNTALLEHYYAQGRGIVLVAGHYNNWEIASQSMSLQLSHQIIGVYAPLKNAFFEKATKRHRARFGMALVPMQQARDFLTHYDHQQRPGITLLAADQSPSNPERAFWTHFLGRETPVFFGPEYFAQKYNLVMVFGHLTKRSRGHYDMRFELIEDQPTQLPYGELTLRHVRALEKDIRDNPQYWLWTHRRWKRQRPASATVFPNLP